MNAEAGDITLAVLAGGPEEGDVVSEARQETQHRAVGNHGRMLAQVQ